MSAQSVLTTTKGALASGPSTAWAPQVGKHSIKFLAERIAPASIFSLFLFGNGSRVYGLLTNIEAADSMGRWQLYAEIAHRSLVTLFLFTVVLLFVIRRPAFRKGTNLRRGAIALGATFVTTLNGLAPTTISSPALALFANLLIVMGMTIALGGLLGLRGCFGILPEARGLVTTGLYGHVRHPIYLGETIATVGLTLPVLSPMTLVVFVAYLLLQLRRAVNEELLLAEAFPRYRDYCTRTKRLLPFLW